MLVTVEVGAFFVGPALGGLALGWSIGTSSVWAAPAVTLAAFVLLRGVRWVEPSLHRDDGEVHHGGLGRLILRSPLARAGLVTVALNNAVDGAVSIVLLPFAIDAWEGGSREFGLATAAMGFGALFAPVLLRIWGLDKAAGQRSTWLFAGFLGVLAMTGGAWWALIPVVIVGASSVHVEAVATGMMQRGVPDGARSSLLGLADSVMVGTAAVAAAVTPYLTEVIGSHAVVVGSALLCATMVLSLQVRKVESADRGYLPDAVSVARR